MTVEELALDAAWAMLSEPDAVLVDVRTTAEWSFVGVPDLASLDKEVRLVEWSRFPSGQPNPDFVTEASAGLSPDQAVLLLCRSGARSRAAAEALAARGFTRTFNVSAGFEGPLDDSAHRHGGWKDHLPWRQS